MQVDKRVVYSAALCSILFSYLIHHPLLSNPIYSDIVSFWHRGFCDARLPYLDLPFEYPPLAGFLTYVSSIAGRSVSSYYTIFSIIVAIFYLLLVEVTVRICRDRGISLGYVMIFLALSPSVILYSIYNFDMIFASMLASSLYLFMKRRLKLSAILFSMASLVKLVNLILLPFLILRLEGRREKVLYAILSLTIFGAVNLALWILNPSFIDETYLYHARWGLENAWFLIFFPSKSSWDLAKIFSLFLLCYGLLKVYVRGFEDLVTEAFVVLAIFLLSNYVFTPQMALWILPLLAAMGRIPIPYLGFELANSMIIILWFESPNPVELGSPPQYFALLRALMLFMLLVEAYFGLGRVGSEREG